MKSRRSEAPTYKNIEEAAVRLRGKSVLTPLLESEAINMLVGGRVLVKAEPLQKTGSFKFRGAYNKVSSLTEKERKKGIITYSSGNHAQAVAAVASMFDIEATILMPLDAPENKKKKTRSSGAKIVSYDRYNDDRQEMLQSIISTSGQCFIPPYEDSMIISGQGTVGVEIMDQTESMGIAPDAVLVCCGGGGLAAGVATAVNHRNAETRVYAVEPEDFDDTCRSLEFGHRMSNSPDARSICDALQTRVGKLTFSIIKRFVAGGVRVSDSEAQSAMAVAFSELQLVSEPGGAVALAAILNGRVKTFGQTVVVVVTGGNVDANLFHQALSAQRRR
jgi:threonine dehydratase